MTIVTAILGRIPSIRDGKTKLVFILVCKLLYLIFIRTVTVTKLGGRLPSEATEQCF